jgi:hypothetical protein
MTSNCIVDLLDAAEHICLCLVLVRQVFAAARSVLSDEKALHRRVDGAASISTLS